MQKSWLSDAVMYHVLIDRFYGSSLNDVDKPVFAGGTISGIIEQLDYIQSLGVNCLWISPFYKGVSYHGYHITDFYGVDEHFGTIDDLENLIKCIHQKGMKIIADLVPNHCSINHSYFVDAKKNRNSTFRNWYYFNESTDDYLSFLGFKELAKINLDDSDAKKYFIDNTLFWLNKGFDGFRIDHIIGVSRLFLADLNKAVKMQNSNAIVIGEAWIEGIRRNVFDTIRIRHSLFHKYFGISQENVQRQYDGLIDGVLDFEARNIILKMFLKENKTEDEILKALTIHFKRYSKKFSLVLFLDNHDTNRIMYECGNDLEKVKRLISILKKCHKPLVFYSGTEQALTHSESIFSGKHFADLDVRQPMDWTKRNTILKM